MPSLSNLADLPGIFRDQFSLFYGRTLVKGLEKNGVETPPRQIANILGQEAAEVGRVLAKVFQNTRPKSGTYKKVLEEAANDSDSPIVAAMLKLLCAPRAEA